MAPLLLGLGNLLASIPDDPFLLVGVAFLAWLPLCAFALGGLVMLAAAQYELNRRRRLRVSLVLPPVWERPLATRRFITNPRQTNGALATTRLALAIAVVTAFSALVLATSGPYLLATLLGNPLDQTPRPASPLVVNGG